MTYIRVQKDKYELDVVIDVTTDKVFAETSGLDWMEIDGDPTPGDYYYQGKFIADHDGEYSTIQQVIHQLEEERKAAEGIVTGEPQPEGVINQNEESTEPNPVMPLEMRWVPPPPPEAPAAALPHDLEEPVERSFRDFPKPTIPELADNRTLEPSTAENLKRWQENNRNHKKLIQRLQSGTGFSIDSNYVMTFTPPLVFENTLNDETYEQVTNPMLDDTVEEYLEYLLKMDEMHLRLIARIAAEL